MQFKRAEVPSKTEQAMINQPLFLPIYLVTGTSTTPFKTLMSVYCIAITWIIVITIRCSLSERQWKPLRPTYSIISVNHSSTETVVKTSISTLVFIKITVPLVIPVRPVSAVYTHKLININMHVFSFVILWSTSLHLEIRLAVTVLVTRIHQQELLGTLTLRPLSITLNAYTIKPTSYITKSYFGALLTYIIRHSPSQLPPVVPACSLE